MGANDHFEESASSVRKCPKCGKQFSVWEEDQVPGFRSKDYLNCPWCHAELASSMEVEYHAAKIE